MTTDAERGTDGGLSAARPALSRLITGSTEDFSRDRWAVSPLLARTTGDDFSDLFSLSAVDELVADRAIRTPFVRMANEGSLLDASRYTGAGGFGAEVADQLDSAKVLAEFAAGSTLVLQGLHRTWEPLAAFTRQLVADLGHPAQVNAYVTPASSRGFDPHYDVHDVFVIQIHGQKHWTIHEPVHENPLRTQPWSDHAAAVAEKAAGTPAIDETFSPGDVLYLPRGWIHSATALGGISIHLTIGVAALTRWDIVRELVDRAAADSGLRGSLPLGIDLTDPATLEALVAETAASLARSVTDADDGLVARRLSSRLRSFTPPEPVAPMATVEALADLGEDTRVRWRQGLGATVTTADTVSIALASRVVALPLEAAAAVTQLEAGTPVAAGRLDGLDAASALVVCRRLLREGILVLA